MNSLPPDDFGHAVELPRITIPDRTRVHVILLLVAVAVLILATAAVALAFPQLPRYYLLPGGLLVLAATPAMNYLGKRRERSAARDRRTTLTLCPTGVRRTDDSIVVDIPWAGITGLRERRVTSGSPSRAPGAPPVIGTVDATANATQSETAWEIIGTGTVTPAPGAAERSLRLHDERSGSRLALGEPWHTPDALILPAEFERDWVSGSIGRWLNHYRPDIRLRE